MSRTGNAEVPSQTGRLIRRPKSMKASSWLLLLPLLAIGCRSPTQEVRIAKPGDLPFAVKWETTYHPLYSVHLVHRSTGWAGGSRGVILHAEAAGKPWAAQASRTEAHLNSVHFVDRSTGWAVGDGGVILHTEDAGKTWAAQA